MIDDGFAGLGLHAIWLTVFSFNMRGLHAYQRAGFKQMGGRPMMSFAWIAWPLNSKALCYTNGCQKSKQKTRNCV
ncbi:hypothetical protein BH10CHL1_BH10CHL1_10580 [soil metagenome]